MLFGNGETDEFDISRLIYGLNSYQRLKASSEIQSAFGIEAHHLSVNAVPPGMKKVIVTRQLGGKMVKSKIVASATATSNNGRKPGRPPSVALTSTSSSAAAAHSLLDDDETDSIVCLNCGDSCTNSSLSRVSEEKYFCEKCTNSVTTSDCGEMIGENEDYNRRGRIDDGSSSNAKRDHHICKSCRKQFNSLAGCQYHVEYVCLGDERKKELDRSQIIRKSDHEKNRTVVNDDGNFISKHTGTSRYDEQYSGHNENFNNRREESLRNDPELDHPRLAHSSAPWENMNRYMSENTRKSILYRNRKMNWLSNPLISLAFCSSGKQAMIKQSYSLARFL